WVWPDEVPTDFYVPQADEETYATLPIAARRDADRLHLYFQPFRDERGGDMYLRIRFKDGRTVAGSFVGGEVDPFVRGPLPNDKSVTANPGDDLHALVTEYGTITLAPGRHVINRPLEIEHPVTITGPRDAIVYFEQPADADAWTYAILIKA